MLYWVACIIVGLLSKILFRVETTGSENIPRRGPFILASNHRSNLDPPIVVTATKRGMYVMGKRELFRSRFSATFMSMLHVIELNREGIDRAALKKGLLALHRGRGLLFFPEGKRSVDGRLGPGRAGVALFAFGANIPVIPVFIKGTERAMPPNSHFIKPAKVKVFFGKELIPPKLNDRTNRKSNYQEFTNRIMQGIAELEKTA